MHSRVFACTAMHQPIILVLLCAVLVTAESHCERGWTYYEKTQSCFKVLSQAGDHNRSQSVCEEKSANLAILKTKGEIELVADLLMSKMKRSKRFHAEIALTSPHKNCNFEWADGTHFDDSFVAFTPMLPWECEEKSCAEIAVGQSRRNGMILYFFHGTPCTKQTYQNSTRNGWLTLCQKPATRTETELFGRSVFN